jgi:hypothetical protein
MKNLPLLPEKNNKVAAAKAYSYFSLSTGLVSAALITWEQTVNTVYLALKYLTLALFLRYKGYENQ